MEFNAIGVVFSRDRAMQLDGALRSYFLHCVDAHKSKLFVIYKVSNIYHKKQYLQLANDYLKYNVMFIEEMNFRDDILRLFYKYSYVLTAWIFFINTIKKIHIINVIYSIIHIKENDDYIIFLVDDNLFVRKFSLETAINALSENHKSVGFSLRLGNNINYCYPNSSFQSIPHNIELANDVLKYEWTSSSNDFAYPIEVSSSIYRARDIFPFLKYFYFSDPNSMESVLSEKSRFFRRWKPFLLCYSKSVTFCNPINKVQQNVSNRSGAISDYSSENLSQMFEKGYRIDVKQYVNFVPNSCHQEVELKMVKINNKE